MKNVTITLNERVAQWARVEAAKDGKSLSRWIGDRLETEMQTGSTQMAGLEALLSLPMAELTQGGKLPSRAEYYDRESLRRHQRDRLRPRSGRGRKKNGSD
jgi:hypothetical protein